MRIRGIILVLGLCFCAGAQAQVTLTFLGTEGVILESGVHKVMVDGFIPEQYAIFQGLTETAAMQQAQAVGPFADIDLALVSHRHFEHFQPDAACRFMKSSPDTLLMSSEQVITIMAQRCKATVQTNPNIRIIRPVLSVPHDISLPGIQVEAFRLSHGSGKFASLDNFGHLISIGGKKILHLGDAASDPGDFVVANLQNKPVDIALVPYTFVLRSSGRIILERFIQTEHILVVHIPPKEVEEVASGVLQHFPEAMVLSRRMEKFYFE